MKNEQLETILQAIHDVTVAVYGDFCLDAYWILDPEGGEISVETGLRAEAVRRHYYTLGGASNVVANVAALQPKSIKVVGVIGDDIFGREMRDQFHDLAVDTSCLTTQKDNYDTVVFSKRYLNDVEQPRIDFGFFNKRSAETDERIINNLRQTLSTCDALIFNQQVPGSISTNFINMANELFKEFADKIIILDSRHYGDKFRNIIRKTNEIEAAQLTGFSETNNSPSTSQLEKIGRQLFDQFNKPVFLTRGDRGILTIESDKITHTPGIHFMKKLDTVGAGDTVISALAAAMAAGFSPSMAAEFANLAAGVTVQKLFQTGTASGEEILDLNREVYFVHQPELAQDERKATYVRGTQIELCADMDARATSSIKHVIFDHDGTISTLRQGWDAVMEQVMIDCILGEHRTTAGAKTVEQVRDRVREFIDMTTGIQTILQMQGLVDMVREFGFVPEKEILDKFGYKKTYNDALMALVHKRRARVQNGELNTADFTIKSAPQFLQQLAQKGLMLYLASGTDHDDVKHEAEILGYASLFNGGIYGALGDVAKFSKRLLIEKIIHEHQLSGSELAVFGDGPVEIQECRKHGGFAIGVASDEVRRFGLNHEKRTRLIKAGAQIIIPDFSQGHKLLDILFKSK